MRRNRRGLREDLNLLVEENNSHNKLGTENARLYDDVVGKPFKKPRRF